MRKSLPAQPATLKQRELIVEWMEQPGNMALLTDTVRERNSTVWLPMSAYIFKEEIEAGGSSPWNEYSMRTRYNCYIKLYQQAKLVAFHPLISASCLPPAQRLSASTRSAHPSIDSMLCFPLPLLFRKAIWTLIQLSFDCPGSVLRPSSPLTQTFPQKKW